MSALADAAAFLAQEWPVFPCAADKKPITPRGFYDATSHQAAVRAMFADPAARLIGVPMGAASRLLCLDIDAGKGGMEWLVANAERIPQTRAHRTMNGGQHLFFKWPKGRNLRNRASKWAPGVDIRGEGGYAIMPPSPGYEIIDASMPADAPAWLLDLIDPPAPPAPTPAPREPYTPPSHARAERYAAAALDAECSAVATAPEGTRNDRLNIAAVKLGSLVAAGALSESTARAELRRAALHAGLDPRETDLTIQSGLGYGLQNPREIPERGERVARVAPEAAPHPLRDPSAPPTDNPTALTDGGKPRHLPLVYWHDIQPSMAGADFVEGLLIEGAMTVVYGPSNCGKTFFCTDLALHVATGRKWRGRDVEPGGVIYCALEGAHGISNRVAAFRKARGLEGVEVPFAIIPVTLDLLDPAADTERLIDAIRIAAAEFAFPVKLVVLDTLSRAMSGGNENSPEDMGALVANGDRIRQATNAHVLWVHHSGKDQAQGARGHSLLRAATDTEIEISRPDKDSPSSAKVTKQRELEIDGEWSFTLARVELGTDRRGKPVSSCVVEEAEPGEMQRRRLAPGAAAGMTALQNALISKGTKPVSPDYPKGARIVRIEHWRTEFYARSHLENYQAKKKAFQRAINDLREAGLVSVLHDYAWMSDADDDA